MTSKTEDEIVEEIRRRRPAHAESLGYDPKRITQDLQRQEKESGAPAVERSPRKPEVVPDETVEAASCRGPTSPPSVLQNASGRSTS